MPETARELLAGSKHGLGAYSESKGVQLRPRGRRRLHPRSATASTPTPRPIYLTDGASKGVQAALRILISGPQRRDHDPHPPVSRCTPRPSPLLRGPAGPLLPRRGATTGSSARRMLEESIAGGRGATGVKVKAICVINPGNPTGSVLDARQHRDGHRLRPGARPRHPGRRGLPGEHLPGRATASCPSPRCWSRRARRDVCLFSFHSCSKGFLGECGQRGGYMEVRNVPARRGRPDDQAAVRQPLREPRRARWRPTAWCGRPSRASPATTSTRRSGTASSRSCGRGRCCWPRGSTGSPASSATSWPGAMYAFPRISLPAGAHGRGLLHGPARGDGHLRGARKRFRADPGDGPLPDDDPAPDGPDPGGREGHRGVPGVVPVDPGRPVRGPALPRAPERDIFFSIRFTSRTRPHRRGGIFRRGRSRPGATAPRRRADQELPGVRHGSENRLRPARPPPVPGRRPLPPLRDTQNLPPPPHRRLPEVPGPPPGDGGG
ncbi:MAG: hypothetical protein MZV64_09315 [Ignavibacteriales bacterium]|nr:hypothetical protein [Ignavibacteriales bacterium]